MCLCVLLVIYCVTLYELCLCGCGCVCVCLFNVRVCCDCELLCDDACWIMCVAVRIRCLMRSRVVCDVVWLYGLLFVFVLLCVCLVYVCECSGGGLWLFVIHCVMMCDVSVMCDVVVVSP